MNFFKTIVVSVALMAFSAPAMLAEEEPERFDRGLGRNKSFVFVPKGTVMAGMSVSYANYDFDNYKFLIVDGMTVSGSSFGIAPHVSYFVKNNLSLGARFDYDTYSIGMGGASIDLSDDLAFDIGDGNVIDRSYLASLTMRNYFPISDSKRFGFFFTFTEHGHTNGLAESVRKGNRTTNHLVRILGINPKGQRYVDGFIKLSKSSGKGLFHGLFHREPLGKVNTFHSLAIFFPESGHCSILSEAEFQHLLPSGACRDVPCFRPFGRFIRCFVRPACAGREVRRGRSPRWAL